MKKIISYLTLFLFSSSFLSAQFVALGNEDITFGSQAAVYIYGGLNTSANTTGTIQIPVGGKVYVDGAFNSSQNFVIRNDGTNTSTGQLIIKDNTPATGTVRVERLFQDQNFPELSFPFNGYSIANLEADIAAGPAPGPTVFMVTEATCPESVVCDQRYASSVFYWNNDRVLNSHVTGASKATAILQSHLRYSLNDAGSLYAPNNTINGVRNTFLGLRGVPRNGNFSVLLTKNNINMNARNFHWEEYYRYILDKFAVGSKWDPASGYGDNIFVLSNPYTSHIDLSTIGFLEGALPNPLMENDGMNFGSRLVGVSIPISAVVDGRGRTVSTSEDIFLTDVSGNFTIGALSEKLIVKPHESFWLKFNPATMGATETFTFSDGLKTFLNTSSSANLRASGGNSFPNARFANARTSNASTYQINLSLVDDSENMSIDNIYVYTNNEDQTKSGELLVREAKYQEDESPSLYTIEESVNGGAKYYGEGINPFRLQINGVNRDFIGKAIPLGVDTKGRKGKLLIELTNLIENGMAVSEFSSRNVNFYFKDKSNKTSVDIKEGFAYEIDAEGIQNNRYEIYMSELPLSVILDGAEELGSVTKVYKESKGVIGVSLDEEELGAKANIFVYSVLGQLIAFRENVETSKGSISIPIDSNSTNYLVVNIVGENGTVVNNKIIL